MKNLLSLLLSAVIILSGLTFAFADDPEEALPPSSGASADIELPASNLPVTITDEDTIQSDLELRQFSVNLSRSIGAPDGTETASDIYNLLYDVITHDTSGFSYFRVYDTDTHVFLQRIINILTDYSGTSSNTESPFYTSGDASSRLSIAQLLLVLTTNVLDLVEMDSSGSSSSLVQYLVNCYNTYISIDGKLSSILNCLTDDYGMTVANRLYDIKSVLFDMRGNELYYTKTWIGNIKDNTQNLINDLSSNGAIASGLSKLDNDLNNINWNFVHSSPTIYDSSFNNLTFSNPLYPGTYYFRFTDSNINGQDSYVYKILLPYIPPYAYQLSNLNLNFEFGTIRNNEFYKFNIQPEYVYIPEQYSFILFIDSSIRPHDFVIKFDTNILLYSYGLTTGVNYGYYYIDSSCNDYYIIGDYVNLKTINSNFEYSNNILSIFKELYASDDLIQAKENQQQYEDQVIDDFTGSGSAAAKASDAASAKDISSAVSSGLNSGGSVNNSLSVFNPSGGFWGWFSQENSDYINNLSSQNRLRSSGSGSDWVIDDPYQRNAEELQSILGGDR